MTDLPAAIARATAALTDCDKTFALVGGFAVSARTEPRLTRDADLAVAVSSDREAEALLASLRLVGYRVSTVVEHEPTGRLATARLVHVDAPELVTDLLFASCGIEPEVVAGADTLAILAGLELPVASVGHLIAMKLLARDDRHRPADADDLAHLGRVASEQDWRVAADAVHLIGARGFDRGRDLAASLTRLRAHGPFGDGW